MFFASIVPSGNPTLGGRAVNRRTQISILSSILLILFLCATPQAEAQRGRGAPNVGRAIRQVGKVPNIRVPNPGRGAIGSPFPLLDALSRIERGNRGYSGTPFPLLDAISRLDKGHNGDKRHSNDALNLLYGLSQFGGYGGGYGFPGYGYGYGHPDAYYGYKADKEYADAMRDAAIAGAVGNVVSAIVTSQSVRTQPPVYVQSAPAYTQPAPVYQQAPPAPVYVQPSPMGHYETRREQVGGGYYERQQVWVPESVDPRTGNVVEGHYETVKKWVPEVIQETRVWVAP